MTTEKKEATEPETKVKHINEVKYVKARPYKNEQYIFRAKFSAIID